MVGVQFVPIVFVVFSNMEIDWNQVKKVTLWDYEKLMAKFSEVLEYSFVREFYTHDMRQAQGYCRQIQQGYRQQGRELDLTEIIDGLSALDRLGVRDYLNLLQIVGTKEKCENFIVNTHFSFETLIQVINYLFRLVLPFKIPIKEILDTMPASTQNYADILRKYQIRSNLDAIEVFRTAQSREKLSLETNISEKNILAMAHRADLTRLAYVRGKTILHLCGGGYDTLNKLANTNMEKMKADMSAYYHSIGKQFSDFQAVIPLDWMIGGAQILPRVMEV